MEYNGYGVASQDPKQRIDRTQATLMLGFKAWISKPQKTVQIIILNLTKTCLGKFQQHMEMSQSPVIVWPYRCFSPILLGGNLRSGVAAHCATSPREQV